MTPMVAPGPTYRIAEGPQTGMIVGLAETHACGGCGGSRLLPGIGGLGYRGCLTCGGTTTMPGSGRLAGSDPYVWPIAVELVDAEAG